MCVAYTCNGALLLLVFAAARECPLATAFTRACLSLTTCTWTVEAKSGVASRLGHGAAVDSTPEPIAPSPSGSSHSSSSISSARSQNRYLLLSHTLLHDKPQAHIGYARTAPPWSRATLMMILLRPSHPSPLVDCCGVVGLHGRAARLLQTDLRVYVGLQRGSTQRVNGLAPTVCIPSVAGSGAQAWRQLRCAAARGPTRSASAAVTAERSLVWF